MVHDILAVVLVIERTVVLGLLSSELNNGERQFEKKFKAKIKNPL